MFTKPAARIFNAFRRAYERQLKKEREILLKDICIKGADTRIDKQAEIQNATGDCTRISIGTNTWIRGHLMVFNHGGNIRIGEHCFVGPDTRIWSAASIVIGNRVLIAHNVNIHDNSSHPLNVKQRHEDFKHIFTMGLRNENDLREKPIVIGDDAWIGYNAIINKGITVGKGAIVGAGTVVTVDVPDYAVIVGNPARIIKYIEP